MVNLKTKKVKIKEKPTEQIALRSGRLAEDERALILQEFGEYAQGVFNTIVNSRPKGYNLAFLDGALHFERDTKTFTNNYWVDTGSDHGNDLAKYFEYGTGLYNTKYQSSGRGKITSNTKGKLMKFRKPWVSPNGKKMTGAFEVKGVQPVYMMMRAIKSVKNNRSALLRNARFKLGI